MTIAEQKRQIVIMQGQVLDSDLTEEEKELKLRALTNYYLLLNKEGYAERVS